MKTSFIIEIVITNIRFNSQYARKIILYHSKPGVWVRNVVMEMTAVMLNTKFYLFTGTSWGSIENGNYPIWHRRDQFTTYPMNVNSACIPHLSEQSMYDVCQSSEWIPL